MKYTLTWGFVNQSWDDQTTNVRVCDTVDSAMEQAEMLMSSLLNNALDAINIELPGIEWEQAAKLTWCRTAPHNLQAMVTVHHVGPIIKLHIIGHF